MKSKADITNEKKPATKSKTQIAINAPDNFGSTIEQSYHGGTDPIKNKTPAPTKLKPSTNATNLRAFNGRKATRSAKQAKQRSENPTIPKAFGFVPMKTTW